MKKTKIIHFNDTEKDLLFWVKRFLANKIASVSLKKTGDDFDLAALVQDINSDATDSIDKVMEVVRFAQRQGLDGLKRPGSNIEKFYQFISQNVKKFPSITSISQVTIEYFAFEENADKTEPAKEALFDVSRNLFNFIDDNTIDGEHLFMITKGKRGKGNSSLSKKTRKRQIVFMSEGEIRRYNKAILEIEYRNEKERNRDILIGRLLLFSGVTIRELSELSDDDLIQDQTENDTIWISIQGKGSARREVPIPKRKIIEYLNAYKRERGDSFNGRLFHTPVDPTKPITENVIHGILKRQFKQAGIDEKKATPTVMRNTFAIFIYGKAHLDGNPNADRYVQKLLGHANIVTTRELVKAGGIQLIKAAAQAANAFKS